MIVETMASIAETIVSVIEKIFFAFSVPIGDGRNPPSSDGQQGSDVGAIDNHKS